MSRRERERENTLQLASASNSSSNGTSYSGECAHYVHPSDSFSLTRLCECQSRRVNDHLQSHSSFVVYVDNAHADTKWFSEANGQESFF